jgi:MoaA/NifB/PqqE/SkfB family radical SAM enzyme
MTKQIRPRSLRLETSTFCQLKCPSCETAKGIIQDNIGSGFLKLKDFQKVVDENSWISHIELSNWGEIFLNPEFSDILVYAYKKSVALTANNGANLNTVKETTLKNLVRYKFRHIKCSIDGSSQETYNIYRKNGNFERVIENIKIINHYKSLYKSNYPLLTWQFIAFGHNEHEIQSARQMANSLNMKFWIKLSWDEEFSPVKNVDLVKSATDSKVASRSEYYQKYGIDYKQKRICSQLWRVPQINWDGRILGCCFNYWGDFGNAFELGVLNGLNTEKISYARQMLLGEVNEKAGIPCTQCPHYKKMKQNGEWLTKNDIAIPKKEQFMHNLGRLGVWVTNKFNF